MKTGHHGYPRNPSRRRFIVGTAAAAGGGLALGFHLPGAAAAAPSAAAGGSEVNAWVVIRPDDTCVIRIARSEMGQGTRTGLAQLVAEELECDWRKVEAESITPGANLARKRAWGAMGTGGSRGIRDSQDYVRRGGAAARIMLVQAAADAVERAGGGALRREGRHQRIPRPAAGLVRQGRGRGVQARAARSCRASCSRTRRRGRSPASR